MKRSPGKRAVSQIEPAGSTRIAKAPTTSAKVLVIRNSGPGDLTVQASGKPDFTLPAGKSIQVQPMAVKTELRELSRMLASRSLVTPSHAVSVIMHNTTRAPAEVEIDATSVSPYGPGGVTTLVAHREPADAAAGDFRCQWVMQALSISIAPHGQVHIFGVGYSFASAELRLEEAAARST